MKKPQITNEESVPSDGKDAEGEKMIDELGKKLDKVPPARGAEPMPKHAGQLIRAAKRRRSETRSTKGRIAVFS